jgi:hypothetical protein
MIRIEKITINGKDFIKTFSDKGVYITRNGLLYKDACDPIAFTRLYEETEEKIKN